MDIKGFKAKDGTVHKYDYASLANKPDPEESPSQGADGGYYTPSVSQPETNKVQFAFTPSKPDMPAVAPVQVELPAGQGSGGNANQGGVAETGLLGKKIKTANVANATAPLDIQMDYSSQPLHPKVLYIPEKFGGHYFWMAYTPYPNHQDAKENPCIACSNDMIHWATPTGMTNPLDVGTANDYNSDTHLVYREDTGLLECWWRRANQTTLTETLFRRTSADGVNWNATETMVVYQSESGTVQCLSPSIIFEDGKYKMWAFAEPTLYYCESADGKVWSEPVQTNFTAWHADVIHTDRGYEILACDGRANKTVSWAYSEDGIKWSDKVIAVTSKAGTWDETALYRPSFFKENGMYYVFYSAQRNNFAENGIGLSISTRYNDIKSLRGYAGAEVPLFTFAEVNSLQSQIARLEATYPIMGISLDKSYASTSDENTVQLKATINPEFSKAYKWVSSDTSVATVDENGLVSPAGTGTATISCVSVWDHEVVASCEVTFINESGITYLEGIATGYNCGYFDTGVVLEHGVDSFELKGRIETNGTLAGNSNSDVTRLSSAQSQIDYMWGARPRLNNTNPAGSGVPFVASYDAETKVLRFTAEGYEDSKVENFTGNADGDSWKIFAGHGTQFGGCAVINYFTIGDKHDFRPAFDPDGKICLYDRIAKTVLKPTKYDNLYPIEYGKTYHNVNGLGGSNKWTIIDNYCPTLIEDGAELVVHLANVEGSGYEITSGSNIRDKGNSGTQYFIDMETMTITVPSVTSDVTANIYTQAVTILTGISASYTGGDVPVGTSVDDLTGITVNASYSDGSTKAVTGYTLSGEIVEGENTITVTYEGMTATFTVTGIAESSGEDNVPCTGISLSSDTLTFTESGSQTLTATVTPDGCTDAVTWKSTNTDIATVEDGVVTVKNNGSVTITATCGAYSASCSVSASGIEATPMYPFTNGVCSVVDNAGTSVGSITITDGNHVNMTRTHPYDCLIPASNLPESTKKNSLSGTVENQNSMFSFKSGDVVRTVVTFSEANAHTAGLSVRLVTANAKTTTDILTSATESGESTYTMTSDLAVGGIGVYLAAGTGVLDCDIEIYVNDVRYV